MCPKSSELEVSSSHVDTASQVDGGDLLVLGGPSLAEQRVGLPVRRRPNLSDRDI